MNSQPEERQVPLTRTSAESGRGEGEGADTDASGSTSAPAPAAVRSALLVPGARPLPEYELVQRLGQGGFGEVWKAIGPGHVEVALKFVHLGSAATSVELRALDLMRGIRHPHLVSIHGAWKQQGTLILALELGEETLHDRLKRDLAQGKAGIPLAELLDLMDEAAKGIDFLNARGIQHRDIKPQNLLLLGGSVKVADFGLAKILEHTMASNSGAMTPLYAPPEFFKELTSSYSDQYSLGITWCQLRANKVPFSGSQHHVMFGHLMETPDLSMLPEPERPAVLRALAKCPSERWPTCRAFIEALRAATRGLDTPAALTASVPRPESAPTDRSATVNSSQTASSSWNVLEVKPATVLSSGTSGPVQIEDTTIARKPKGKYRLLLAMAGLAAAIVVVLSLVIPRGPGDGAPASKPPQPDERVEAPPEKAAPGKPPTEVAATNPTPPPIPAKVAPARLVAPFTQEQAKAAQETWSRHLGVPLETSNSIGLRLILIPPGTFAMGTPEDEVDHQYDEIQHKVTISRAFYMGIYEVTQAEYRAIMGGAPYSTRYEKPTMDSKRLPVGGLTWYEAIQFCNKLSERENRTPIYRIDNAQYGPKGILAATVTLLPGTGYRLPTEAEWEYACRAGTTTRFSTGNTLTDKDAKVGAIFSSPVAVGSYPPNPFGLYDMHGNVWEWCWDWYAHYGPEEVDPLGTAEDSHRVERGGSWHETSRYCRSAQRHAKIPSDYVSYLGFRIVRPVMDGR